MNEQMRVDHVSIAVNDIDRALAFFGACLPIELRVHKRQGYNDDFNWCDFYVGQFKLELIEPRHSDSFVRRFIDKRGEGMHHLSLEATHLEPLLARLAADGVRIVDRFDGGNGDVTAFISPRSAHGVLVQFWNADGIVPPERPHTAPFRLRSGKTVKVRVNHVSMAVRSIDRTLDFYRRHFSAQPEHPKHPGYDGSFILTTFTLNGYRIELIEPAPGHEEGFVARFLAKRGEGFHHLSVDVDHLDPLVAQLEADGVRIVDKADIGGGWKTAFISPRSAYGVLIQFWQDPALGG
jgi:methylmalonyl-CoA/ethylmalonyl-CoA epimerase